ncbi:hypothetical protein BY996DRAFT_6582387 [Phakopsora pachyrhizi]|nr:hypothetical protein BY996DRAFT_6582387 [Phakopsora pachyrhizi]
MSPVQQLSWANQTDLVPDGLPELPRFPENPPNPDMPQAAPSPLITWCQRLIADAGPTGHTVVDKTQLTLLDSLIQLEISRSQSDEFFQSFALKKFEAIESLLLKLTTNAPPPPPPSQPSPCSWAEITASNYSLPKKPATKPPPNKILNKFKLSPKLHVGLLTKPTKATRREEVKGNRTAKVEGSDAVGSKVTGGGRPAGSARLADTEIYSRQSARESGRGERQSDRQVVRRSKALMVTGGGRPAGSARLADTEIYSRQSARESGRGERQSDRQVVRRSKALMVTGGGRPAGSARLAYIADNLQGKALAVGLNVLNDM